MVVGTVGYGGGGAGASTALGGHQHPTQTKNTTTGTCATRVGMTSRSGTLAPRVTIANMGTRSVALGRMRSNTPQGGITSAQKERTR